MTQSDFFKSAKWVGAADRTADTFSVLRGRFDVQNAKKVSINVVGLGFFKCYINGILINPDTFLPLSSDYENSNDPIDEILTAHRLYVPQFDIIPFVKNGTNTVAIHFGGGWYTHKCRPFGLPKAIYCITAEVDDGEQVFMSDECCRVGKSYVDGYYFTTFENHNYTDFDFNCFSSDFDDSAWDNATVTEQLDTEYCTTDCPWDKVLKVTSPKIVAKRQASVVYDCGKNLTGYPVLKLKALEGESVTYTVSEELNADGTLDMTHHHKQAMTFVSDGVERSASAQFTWHCFRYIEVKGKAEVEYVKEIYADVPVTSTFECDNETLNWAYKTFLHTMLCNMHTGHPSDCPHIERRGYTGDGQLTCHAVLTTMDSKAFYKKWMQDISDGQDINSGHIQYTAPYIKSGGGPGGWGCAIVEVPYQLYRHYGDRSVLEKYYGQMRRYIDYLEAHSEFGLVTSDKAGAWCLGDWCGPNILYTDKDITSHNQQVMLPAPMVNTYFMVRSLKQMCEIAQIIGKDDDIAEYEEKITTRLKAITAAYFNAFDGNFFMNVQGANSFAVDLGLGNKNTYDNMVSYYKKLGNYDTGIFATDILTRVLLRNGNADLAVELLTADGPQGFEHWRRNGATTFHEYWDSNRSRSHCHPMFGAVIAYFFEYLLGIKQTDGTAGYKSVIIEPMAYTRFEHMSGSIETPNGKVAVSYKQNGDQYDFTVLIPKDTKAVFKSPDGEETKLSVGENFVSVPVKKTLDNHD